MTLDDYQKRFRDICDALVEGITEVKNAYVADLKALTDEAKDSMTENPVGFGAITKAEQDRSGDMLEKAFS